MISYRSVKRLLGETSLERKCRFLFGAGLLVLITSSFYSYAVLTDRLLIEQKASMARDLVPHLVNIEHYVSELEAAEEAAGTDRQPGSEWAARPSQPVMNAADNGILAWSVGPATTDKDQEYQKRLVLDPTSHIRADETIDDRKVLFFYQLALAEQSCIDCHLQKRIVTSLAPNPEEVQAGDPLGLVRIEMSLDESTQAGDRNSLLLLALAILTAFLAMLGAYAIVRYVIVKPVLHLKEVSDEISRGNLELRADINTGDEFEQLSHAFNRMLRHMTTVNDELRSLNEDLDAKVDQLAQVNLRLYETNKMKDEFLATMSHELRTPLNSIIGFSDVLLASSSLSEKEQRYVRTIQSSGQSLLALINDLLDLAKIESGKMDLQPVEFEIEELIERQTTNIAPLAEKRNIELKWDVAPGVPKLLQDFGKLSQILNNLLSNAIKFTPEGGRVRVSGRQQDRDNIEILVEDSGIGIPLDEQEKVFEKFRQGTTTPGERDHMTREYEGTGLGLSIVRELTQLLGGQVSLVSEFGKGSTFKVRVPVEVSLQPPEPVDLDADTEVDASPVAASGHGNPAANH